MRYLEEGDQDRILRRYAILIFVPALLIVAGFVVVCLHAGPAKADGQSPPFVAAAGVAAALLLAANTVGIMLLVRRSGLESEFNEYLQSRWIIKFARAALPVIIAVKVALYLWTACVRPH
jgi:hypothetical protein